MTPSTSLFRNTIWSDINVLYLNRDRCRQRHIQNKESILNLLYLLISEEGIYDLQKKSNTSKERHATLKSFGVSASQMVVRGDTPGGAW